MYVTCNDNKKTLGATDNQQLFYVDDLRVNIACVHDVKCAWISKNSDYHVTIYIHTCANKSKYTFMQVHIQQTQGS